MGHFFVSLLLGYDEAATEGVELCFAYFEGDSLRLLIGLILQFDTVEFIGF